MPVAIVHWPRDAARRADLAERGVPRLLVVDPGTPPPAVADDEDWIRAPADERDVSARLDGLRARGAGVVLEAGVVRTARGAAALSPREAAVAEVLLADPGAVVPRDRVEAALGGHMAVTARSADDAVYRLRRRLRPLGLDVFSSRGRGFLLGPRLDLSDADS
jgi:DNA-binding response OmpR family regulator